MKTVLSKAIKGINWDFRVMKNVKRFLLTKMRVCVMFVSER